MLVADALKGGVLLAARATLNLSLADLFSSLSRGKKMACARSDLHATGSFFLHLFVVRNRPGAAPLRPGTRGGCELTVVVARSLPLRRDRPEWGTNVSPRACLAATSLARFQALLTQPTWLVLGERCLLPPIFFSSPFLQCTSSSGDVYRSGLPFLLGQLLSRAVPTLHNIVT